MTLGELFLESLSTGVITEDEVDWLASHQHVFSRAEEAAAVRLGRLMDDGVVNLGCRVSPQWFQHRDVVEHWIEPLGRRRHAAARAARSEGCLRARGDGASVTGMRQEVGARRESRTL